jgi:hypothetical protein
MPSAWGSIPRCMRGTPCAPDERCQAWSLNLQDDGSVAPPFGRDANGYVRDAGNLQGTRGRRPAVSQPRYAPRARVRALWGLSGWRGNERIADSIKKGPPGAGAGGGCCSGSDRAPNFQGSAGRERNPVRGLAQLASLWLIACPASKLRHTCSDHC